MMSIRQDDKPLVDHKNDKGHVCYARRDPFQPLQKIKQNCCRHFLLDDLCERWVEVEKFKFGGEGGHIMEINEE